MKSLGINIDHVATLRQARGEGFPDPIEAARACEKAGCDSIVAHLREDRRHINERDIERLVAKIGTILNLEMSTSSEIVDIACSLRPSRVTLVPEKRQELTTEGGLEILKYLKKITVSVETLKKQDIGCSLFIDPDREAISAAKSTGADAIELHTGNYARAFALGEKNAIDREFERLAAGARYANNLGLAVNVGHGLDYNNVSRIVSIKETREFNIGFSVIARSLFVGITEAVREMARLVKGG